MIEYNPQNNHYKVVWEGETPSEASWIPRIYLLFLSEDPFVFAQRIASAIKSKKEAEAFLRYNLYIDSMPADEEPEHEQLLKILASALNVKKFGSMKKDAESKLREITSVYGRAMNKIIFDRTILQQEGQNEVLSLFNMDITALVENPSTTR